MNLDLHTSSNGWLAWVERDLVANNNVLASNKQQFMIVGFLPTGQFCIAPNFYTSVEQAQEIISSLDKQTTTFESGDQLIKVFTSFDGSYWWYASLFNGEKYPVEQIYQVQNTTEAIELIGTKLSCSTTQRRYSKRISSTYIYPQYLSA